MIQYEAKCMLCGHKLPIGLLISLNGKYLCKSCWNEEREKIMKDLVYRALKKRGVWNPSER